MVPAVTLLTDSFTSFTLKVDRSGIKEYKVKAGEQITTLKKDTFFNKLFDTSWGKGRCIFLIFYHFPQKGHCTIQVMQRKILYCFYHIVPAPFFTSPVRSRCKEPMKHG